MIGACSSYIIIKAAGRFGGGAVTALNGFLSTIEGGGVSLRAIERGRLEALYAVDPEPFPCSAISAAAATKGSS